MLKTQTKTKGQAWQEATGVELEIMQLADNEALNLLYASGELPDIIVYDMGELRFAYQRVTEGLERAELLGGYGVVDMGGGEESGGRAIVQRVIQYVEEHYADSNLNISTIAEGMERNPKYISRVFKEETQEGILDYMNRLRIKKAKVLIKSGRFTLEQISGMVGYASLKTFRRAFQKETGLTPAGYRDSLL